MGGVHEQSPTLSDNDTDFDVEYFLNSKFAPTPMDIDSSGDAEEMEALEKFRRKAGRVFFDEWGFISHQINSYNEFVERGLQDLVDSLGEVTVEPGYDPSKKGDGGWRQATITYGRVRMERPTFWSEREDFKGKEDATEQELKLLPWHARLQNMTYASQVKVEARVRVFVNEKSDKAKSGKSAYVYKKVLSDDTKEIVMGRIPVMIKSSLCWLRKSDKGDCLFDFGGYFLIKGMEKAFVAQEQRCLARLWVADQPARMVSYLSEIKRKRIYVKLVEAPKAEGLIGGKVATVSFLFATVPIWIMFFSLGASSDKEVFQMIDVDEDDATVVNIILATIRDAEQQCEGFCKADKARDYVNELVKGSKFPPSGSFDEYVTKYLFPPITGLNQKALFLGYMVKCLLLSCTGKRKCDNKNDFRNKRLDLAGELLSRELRSHIRHAERRMVKVMQKELYGDRDLQLIERYWDASIITNGLNRAFSSGAWCHPYKRTERCSGVVATLRRTNPLQMISDLRKTRQQVTYAGKAGDARYPNPSYWGKLCFLSTPDGENCGLVKNLAVTALISTKLMEPTLDNLFSCGMKKLKEVPLDSVSKMDKVFLNGDWIGVCLDSNSFVVKFKSMRRAKLIHPQVEVKMDKHQKEVRVFSDAGRILRPLLVVENLKKIKTLKDDFDFQTLLDEQIVEFIGVEEEEDCLTAWGIKTLLTKDEGQPSPSYSHCELDLSFLLGLSCGIIPFANHNFARRVLYQSEKHSQQAIGFSTTNPSIRVDTLSHQLFYPQKPLFKSMIADCFGEVEYSLGRKDSRPGYFNGQNAIVAVNVHLGYNQEDSLVMNKSSLDRGMFRTQHFRSYKAEIDNTDCSKRLKSKERVDFGKMQSKKGSVDSLDDDGFPYISASLQTGDIIIGKMADSGKDHSIKLKHTEKGMVQKVVLSANDEGKNFAVVTLRQVRTPCLGDKFSSMHGQKGVIGLLESQENFTFTHEGIVPDIVINPHAFPTRQTPGQLLEAALGKGIASGGLVKYATPFTTTSVEVITEQLHSSGYSRWGSEKVINGRTGEYTRSMIFTGPTFYQRLIHMAEDKVKFRNTGPVHPLTRQPVVDRKRFGGVKFGEMERDCLLAHGAAANLHERLFMLSDFSQMHICQKCQRVSNVIQRPMPSGKKLRGPYCRFCKSAENIVRINVPYGAKLLYQELFSMGIFLKFDTEVC